jgi:hypothetical protein
MATGEEHVAAAAVEETPEKKEASVTELPAPSGWTKKVCPRCRPAPPFPNYLASSLLAARFGPESRGSEGCGGVLALGSGGLGLRLSEFLRGVSVRADGVGVVGF